MLVINGKLITAPLRAKTLSFCTLVIWATSICEARAINHQIGKLRRGQRRDFHASTILRFNEGITAAGIVRKGRERGEIGHAIRITRQHLRRPIGNARQRREAQGRARQGVQSHHVESGGAVKDRQIRKTQRGARFRLISRAEGIRGHARNQREAHHRAVAREDIRPSGRSSFGRRPSATSHHQPSN